MGLVIVVGSDHRRVDGDLLREPLSLIVNAMAGRILLFAGQVDPAIEQLQKTLEIEPDFSLASPSFRQLGAPAAPSITGGCVAIL